MSIRKGKEAEKLARTFLESQGLKFIDRNFNSRVGEIDLIMRDNEFLIFVEVRSRKSTVYGGALASVNYHKQQKILKAASLYLLTKNLYDNTPVRFDVVTLDGVPVQFSWIKNAFGN